MNRLCMYCDEKYTPGHHLRHKRAQLYVFEGEDDDSGREPCICDPEVAKFREQDLKFLPEMEFLFKGTIVTGFASYAPSEDSRQNEGFNTRMKETNDNIDNNTKIDMTTQIMSSAKESGQRKRA
ncbi:hypothetical protein JHK85_051623 [Glycine max]|nr:hypothetical protein JHK85_051623 [Glycine max]